MPTNVLTDAQIKRLAPREKPYKVFDGGGLFLYVSPTAKLWRFAYRLDGKQQTKSLGKYPLVTLAEARKLRDEAKRLLQAGETLKPKAVTTKPTLARVSAEYWASRQDLSADYRQNAESALARYVLPRLGERPIDQIKRDDVMVILNGMNAAGRFVYLRKVRMWLGQVLDHAVEHGYVEANVAQAIRTERAFGRRRVTHFAALELQEIGPFLQRLSCERDIDSVLAMQLLAHTWLRTGELRNLQVDDLGRSPGLDGWRLLIPAGRMKRSRDHIVPLSAQAKELFDRAKLRNRGSAYLFPSFHRLDRPMSENTVLALIARMGYKGRMTGHGWRTIASTWANEAGYRGDAIERQLAHQPEDEVRATYNRAEYLPERASMLQDWSNWLDAQQQQQAQTRSPSPPA